VFAVLEALSAVLDAGEAGAEGGMNRCVHLVEEAGGCERLEALQSHANADIYAKAAELLDAYFGEIDAEDLQVAPVSSTETFCFGVPGAGAAAGMRS